MCARPSRIRLPRNICLPQRTSGSVPPTSPMPRTSQAGESWMLTHRIDGPTTPGSGILLVLGILLTLSCRSCDSCQFPSHWSGSWFQKGVQDPIRIYNGTLSNKGVCRHADGDKFLIESRSEPCFRCVVIHEKHVNVLQYKETYCSPPQHHQSLDALCSEINGDALLFSMFRQNTAPVQCPFRGPYTFTYSRGHGECRYPTSNVDSCTDDSHLLFRFQACADVHGSESRVEELVCLASWKEGSTRYLVGKMVHKMAKTDEDKFRCFVYEKNKEHSGYLVAQSGDATCDGLFSATEGSRTLRLEKSIHPHAKCQFSDWTGVSHQWKSLDGRQTYVIGQKNSSFRVTTTTTGHLLMRVVCSRDHHQTDTYTQLIAHATSGCNNGYMCMRIHKRAAHVTEFQRGHLVTHASEACSSHYFDPASAEYITLTTSVPDAGECPLVGIYTMEGPYSMIAHLETIDNPPCSQDSTLSSGCSAMDRMELLEECTSETKVRRFQCHGSWEENGTYYLIATAMGYTKRYCISFADNARVLRFSGSSDMCLRNPPLGREGLVTFNVTNKGVCSQRNGARSTRITSIQLLVLCWFVPFVIRAR